MIIITGLTASGKTFISEKVARIVDGEIISADSRAVYRGINIGNGLYTMSKNIPYHLTGYVDLGVNYSSFRWVTDARRKILEIKDRDRLPIICGGTIHYIQMLIDGFDPLPEPDEEKRKELKEIAEKDGSSYVHRILSGKNTLLAGKVHSNNIKRILRYLEISEGSSVNKRIPPLEEKYKLFFISRPGKKLDKRISERIDQMIELGWINEAGSLLENGYNPDTIGLDAIGFKEIFSVIEGSREISEAKKTIFKATREYSKKQMKWISRLNPRLLEIEDDDDFSFAIEKILDIVGDQE